MDYCNYNMKPFISNSYVLFDGKSDLCIQLTTKDLNYDLELFHKLKEMIKWNTLIFSPENQ